MKRIVTVGLLALLVGGLAMAGMAAAQPGNAPDDAGPPSSVGPSGGLLDPVPDFVGDILHRITEGIDALGQAVSDIASSATPGAETDG